MMDRLLLDTGKQPPEGVLHKLPPQQWSWQLVAPLKREVTQWDYVWAGLSIYQQVAAADPHNSLDGGNYTFILRSRWEGWRVNSKAGVVWNRPHLYTAPRGPPPAHHTHTGMAHHLHQALTTQNTSTDMHVQRGTRSPHRLKPATTLRIEHSCHVY